jgi:ribosomal protein L35
MKTNKSYSKRLKVTKRGKVLARGKGGNHYNAKESRGVQLRRKRKTAFEITNKNKSRFLSGI